jgi:hypothetical protein
MIIYERIIPLLAAKPVEFVLSLPENFLLRHLPLFGIAIHIDVVDHTNSPE